MIASCQHEKGSRPGHFAWTGSLCTAALANWAGQKSHDSSMMHCSAARCQKVMMEEAAQGPRTCMLVDAQSD
eukprot:1160217-Pelagomonas_calceolata.AAC.14